MASLSTILTLMKLPLDILFVIIKYFLGATKFRKYQNRLLICIKLTIYRAALSLPIKESAVLHFMSNTTLFKVLKVAFPSVVKTIPGYGEKYKSFGIWLAKDPNRTVDDPIIIYIHGGGYFMETQIEQLKSLTAMYKLIDPSKKVSVLVLDYDLIPYGHQFPRQLRQLDSIYSSLVEDGNKNLILMGDSAGGHLSISYTEFIKVKRPYLPVPNKLVLISPWVNFKVTEDDFKPGKSYYENEGWDLIRYLQFSNKENNLMFIQEKNALNHSYFDWSFRLPVDWKTNPFFSNDKCETFVIYGEDESFRDDIDTWIHQIYNVPQIKSYGKSNNKLLPEFSFSSNEKNKPKLTAYVEPWGVHDAFFFVEDNIINDYKKFPSLSDDKYFATIRIVNYLNESL